QGTRRLVDTELCESRIAQLLVVFGNGENADEEDYHRPEHCPALPGVPNHPPEGVGQCSGNEENRDHLEKVRKRGWVLVRMSGIGIDESATVGAELLDGFLGGHGTHWQCLGVRRGSFRYRVAGGVLDGVALGIRLGLLKVQL